MGSKIKKLLSLLMVVCMIASMLPTTVFATTGDDTTSTENSVDYANIYENKYKADGYVQHVVDSEEDWETVSTVTRTFSTADVEGLFVPNRDEDSQGNKLDEEFLDNATTPSVPEEDVEQPSEETPSVEEETPSIEEVPSEEEIPSDVPSEEVPSEEEIPEEQPSENE